MRQALLSIALRLTLCVGIVYALWRMLGAIGLAVGTPLFGLALARPLQELFERLSHAIKWQAYRDINGRHFEHRGQMLDIIDDEAQFRWLRLADVRKLLPGLPLDASLQRLFPNEVRLGPGKASRIQAEALQRFLLRAQQPEALKFRHWLEREVIYPAAQRRARAPRAASPDAAPALPDLADQKKPSAFGE